jgi:hypothetical protein
MAANHPALTTHLDEQWRDVHFANDVVRCTRYEVTPRAGTLQGLLAEVGGAVRAVVADAFATGQPLRVPGGRWSLSTIGKPRASMLDLGNYRSIGPVMPQWLTPQYAALSAQSGVGATLIAAGMTVNVVNRELAKAGRALKTSGASDGQTFAGAIATGTHGADLKVGALHDTVLAVHLVVSPTRSVLIQPAAGALNGEAASTLASWFGMPCDLLSDDQLFRAVKVHLGSLGVVLNVVVETVPLYYLDRERTAHRDGASWRAVLTSRNPKNANGLHGADPDYLQFIVNPYVPSPETDPRAWMISMRKVPYTGQAGVITTPTESSLKSDLADFLPALVTFYQQNIELPGNPVLRLVTSSQLRKIYGANANSTSALPGAMFGPPDFLGIDFNPVRGASAEYVFDATQARLGVETILDTLASQLAAAQHQYLGGIGIRFVKGSNGWLAPNAKAMNCFVELQSLHTQELPAIHAAIGAALSQAGVPYGGHWGQWFMNTPQVAERWWGADAVQSWKAARADLLPTAAARDIFASPILTGAGLG